MGVAGGPSRSIAVELAVYVCGNLNPRSRGGVDQRGVARSRAGDTRCDIGAFEFVNLTLLPTRLDFGPQVIGRATAVQTISATTHQTTVITLKESIGEDIRPLTGHFI